jgi:hypothetical protein
MTTLKINMPPELAKQVEAAVLLAQDRLIALFEEALRQARRAALFDTVRRNQAIGEELLSPSEIQAEIVAARRARLA